MDEEWRNSSTCELRSLAADRSLLPDTLSGLLRLAVRDAQAVEASGGTLNIMAWLYTGSGGQCTACMAGDGFAPFFFCGVVSPLRWVTGGVRYTGDVARFRSWYRYNDRSGFLVILGGILLVVGIVALVIWDQKRWQRYAAEHHCAVVGYGGYWAFMPMACGKGCVMVVPMYINTTTYLCDNHQYVTR